MKRLGAFLLLLGWFAGVASGLVYVEVAGGWYEYRLPDVGENLRATVNQDGWEPYPGSPGASGIVFLRRPRFRLR